MGLALMRGVAINMETGEVVCEGIEKGYNRLAFFEKWNVNHKSAPELQWRHTWIAIAILFFLLIVVSCSDEDTRQQINAKWSVTSFVPDDTYVVIAVDGIARESVFFSNGHAEGVYPVYVGQVFELRIYNPDKTIIESRYYDVIVNKWEKRVPYNPGCECVFSYALTN
jgi:hypothetical protein